MDFLDLLAELKKHQQQSSFANKEFEQAFELLYSLDRNQLKAKLFQLERLLKLKHGAESQRSKPEWNGKKSQLVGKAFENVVNCLLDNNFFIVRQNTRTGAGEIDALLTVNNLHAFLTKQFSNGENVLCESKCHDKIILESQWVARLHGLMPTHGARTALIFSFGKSGTIPLESRTQMYAAWLQSKLLIVPIGRKQVKEIISGKSFLTIVNDQGGQVEANATRLSI